MKDTRVDLRSVAHMFQTRKCKEVFTILKRIKLSLVTKTHMDIQNHRVTRVCELLHITAQIEIILKYPYFYLMTKFAYNMITEGNETRKNT